QIDASNIGFNHTFNLDTGSSGSTIKGLVINGFSNTGIEVQHGSGGNLISGNFLGTNPAGTAAVSSTGVPVRTEFDSGSGNVIGGTSPAARNVLSGNSVAIDLNQGGGSNIVQGNYIGVDASGSTALPCFAGIVIEQDCSNN